ncbi:MAG: hypothetical protein M5R36_04390 [Deltaproteobacteria bacterium]|nr:hypothetical protein [Deltaproteobacteria bacterium]
MTIAAAALAGAATWYFFLPFAYHLALTTCRAALPWFTYYDLYFGLSEKFWKSGFCAVALLVSAGLFPDAAPPRRRAA